jgi:TPR repeat protein
MSDAASLALRNPFPGLRPFREDEEHLFFGRESQVDAMVDRLADTHFLAVVGTSGSGKSSLVNCGLRPALRQGLMARAGAAWRMAQFRPGNDPIGAMARALGKEGVLFREDAAEGLPLAEIVETSLRMSKLGLIDVFEQARLEEGVNLLVVVDQFEELFRYRQLETSRGDQRINEDAAAFVNLLLEVKQQKTYPIFVVLTMRSDFLGDCTQFAGLAEAINAGQYLVPRLTRNERRAAIEGPIRVGGAEIAPVLLTRLVNDVGDNPDQLSILQHALNRTWARWREEGGEGPLDLRHYEAIGTMASALDQHAEQAYAELGGPRRQLICELLFKALTDKATDPRGVRRPTKLGDLCALTDSTEAEVIEVIDVFREPSRSFLMPPAGDALQARTVIDISHESLMRVWRRLNSWLDQEAQAAQAYRRLADTAALHATGAASLWRDPDLQLALNWRDNNHPNESWASRYHPGFTAAMDFLTQSSEAREAERTEREQQRQRELETAKEKAEAQAKEARRMLRWAVLCGGLAVFAVICGVVAYRLYLTAVSQQEEAVQIDKLEQEFVEASLAGGAPRSGDTRPLSETQIADLARNGRDTYAEMMGAIFERGITVSRNLKMAIPWYSMAADHGRVVAMRRLGEIYETGDAANGLARDSSQAEQWYEKASDHGDSEAMRRLGAIYQNDPDPLKALVQYDKAADHGSDVAWCDLGWFIENRKIPQEQIPTELEKARQWTEASTPVNMRNCGLRYENGQAVPRDYFKARYWYEKAAKAGDTDAKRSLGFLYETNSGGVQDYSKARELLQEAANAGDPIAERGLGLLYQNGQAGPRDYAKAREWYEKAAEAGDVLAMRSLGLLYENSQAGSPDYAKAREWSEKAAAAGDVLAMQSLGFLYQNGQGGPQDYAKAREWFEKAAEAGGVRVMRSLGLLYENGQGGPQDYAKAREWYEKAVTQGHDALAMCDLGLFLLRGVDGTKDSAKARDWSQNSADAAKRNCGVQYQGSKDYAKAREWFVNAAEGGDTSAMQSLGFLYQNGQGWPQDYAKAREWFEKAAEAGGVRVMRSLGLLYENGQGGPQDYAKAREWYEKAATQGHDALAMCDLGLVLLRGVDGTKDSAKARDWSQKSADAAKRNCGVQYQGSKDYAKAREWFVNAAEGGDTSAMRDLGSLYENSESGLQDFTKAREWFEKAAAAGDVVAMRSLGEPVDYAKARDWFEKAATAGDAAAMRSLGLLYENGQGGAQDFLQARQWYEKAAAQGNTLAMCDLSFLLEQGLGAPKDPARARSCGDAYGNESDSALFARDFTRALAAAERAHSLEPDKLWIENNHAHALMFLDRTEEARALYLSHRDEPTQGSANTPWRKAVADDFAKFRAKGLFKPLMDEIEAVMSTKH